MMNDAMSLEAYLAQGGVLTTPDNVPARYRGELLRLMSAFVDSELAASAGFAASINHAPDIQARIAASRITLEKADHAERVLAVMASFGADAARYETTHDWAARLPRDADLGHARQEGDMRLSVFHYPITGWTDAVVMNVLQGMATGVQMGELTRLSYAPLAEVFRAIAPREARHRELGSEALARLVLTDPEGVRSAVEYWSPRVRAGFGIAGSDRFAMLRNLGLRHETNEDLRARWEQSSKQHLADLGL